eukprot:GEMP01029699.1.p1 GENE.GEMP01029699.1~~GEMP01029699.1.p1  ORF type:complete len:565 (+),score=121.50 GEMP01029699.1:22-1716(+)
MDPGDSNDVPTLANANASDLTPKIAVDGQDECPSLVPSCDAVADASSSKDAPPPTAHAQFCAFLSKIHVVDMLPERSTVCTFDASLPIYEMISTLVAVNHRPLEAWLSDNTSSDAETKLQVEAVAANLASNVLAEICEFFEDKSATHTPGGGIKEEKSVGFDRGSGGDEKTSEPPQQRPWSGPSDEWGCHLTVEGETMGWLQMPFTVQELAEFLAFSSSESEDGSMLDWDLSRWRKHKEQPTGEAHKRVRLGSFLTELPSPGPPSDDGALQSPTGTLVQRTEGAPPRPMLRIDEPDSTFLRAVDLLLLHPELNALPVVSLSPRTVVAHLTLAECMALLVQHLRGKNVEVLGELTLPDTHQTFVQWKEKKDVIMMGETLKDECIVLHADNDTLLDLLDFFAHTIFTAAPVVTDGNIFVGVLGRRNLLQFLDLCMGSCVTAKRERELQEEMTHEKHEDREECREALEEIVFDVSLPLRQVIQTLQNYSKETGEESHFFGAGTTTESLPLKSLLCKIILSDNHKVAMIETVDEQVFLRRFIHVDEVMKLILYGDCAAQSRLALLEDA